MTLRSLVRVALLVHAVCGVPQRCRAALASADSPDSQSRSRYTSDEIRAAWKNRQDRVRSYSVEWTEEFTISKGALGRPTGASKNETGGDPAPPHDVSEPGQGRLLIDGNQGRYWETRKQWSSHTNGIVTQESLKVCNGAERRELNALNALGYPKGIIAKDTTLSSLFELETCLPVIIVLRVLDPAFTVIPVKGMALQDVMLAESRPVVLATVPRGFGQTQMWLDPGRAFVPVRVSFLTKEGDTSGDIDISYPDAMTDGEWIPAEWTARNYEGATGVPRFTRHVKLVHFVATPSTLVSDFALEYPTGAWIDDVTRGASFIVLPNGSWRQLAPYESVRDYDRIMAAGGFGLGYWVCAIVVTVMALGALWSWRRIKRRA